MLKGIQSVADARKALEIGCEGIVVSNHAGRQVDGAVASLDVLPEIADAVGESECSSCINIRIVPLNLLRHVLLRNEDYI